MSSADSPSSNQLTCTQAPSGTLLTRRLMESIGASVVGCAAGGSLFSRNSRTEAQATSLWLRTLRTAIRRSEHASEQNRQTEREAAATASTCCGAAKHSRFRGFGGPRWFAPLGIARALFGATPAHGRSLAPPPSVPPLAAGRQAAASARASRRDHQKKACCVVSGCGLSPPTLRGRGLCINAQAVLSLLSAAVPRRRDFLSAAR